MLTTSSIDLDAFTDVATLAFDVQLDIERGSAAARLGLRPGDVIVEMNRRRVDSPDDIVRGYQSAKSRVLLLIYRDGRTLYVATRK